MSEKYFSSPDMSKNIVIVGAGPAGLTAARELQVAGEKSVIVI